MNLVCAPGGKAFWKDRAYMFGDQFRRYVESDLMTREPHPDAKPMGAFTSAECRIKAKRGNQLPDLFDSVAVIEIREERPDDILLRD